MKLSILMPVFNEADTVEVVVKRVLDVPYPCDVELVIVDDGRSDGTGTLLFTGSAGLFTVDDGSQCNEDSPVAPLGVSERNDRCKTSAPRLVFQMLTGSVHGGVLLL